jgi:hypothetical protein
MIPKNWRQLYSNHPEDFDYFGNPLPTAILEKRRRKEQSEELLTQLIDVVRNFPGQFRRLLIHVLNTEVDSGRNG